MGYLRACWRAVRAQIAAKKSEWWRYLTEQHGELMRGWRADEARYRAAAEKIKAPFGKLFEAEDFSGQTGLRIAQLMRDGKGVEVIETLLPKASDEELDRLVTVAMQVIDEEAKG